VYSEVLTLTVVPYFDNLNPFAGIFSQCSQLPSGYKEQDAALCQRYRPIEIDPNISREEKARHMVDWYQEAEKLLCGFEFRAEELEDVIKKEGAELRYLCLVCPHITVLLQAAVSS
jgi:hypothetical protein